MEAQEEIIRKFTVFAEDFTDSEMAPEVFRWQLTQARDAWFVEVGDAGLVFLTQVVPGYNAYVNIAFWDRLFSEDRIDLVRVVCRTAFDLFGLIRLSALLHDRNGPVIGKMKKVGFTKEGVIRKGWRGQGNAALMGMLQEDIPCGVPPMLRSSLD